MGSRKCRKNNRGAIRKIASQVACKDKHNKLKMETRYISTMTKPGGRAKPKKIA